ncbi:hypothetical protein Hypma_010483 [Hypsizygus marmoreus]|uniref:F-box domain-containing protein n=1 Tax=Hypsizygus marmoreus TaxID=39966 RepID=A0A369JM10_HYPMA|nr:hypothetical protein Hypma_010483 [Hypsizygus marmoreus]
MPLPLDIIHEILSRCSFQTLVSVALVNTSFHHEAERLLYRKIKLTKPMGPRVIRCLTTLSTIPKKAALVQSFSAFTYTEELTAEQNELLVEGLCSSLIGMVSLQHLWLRLRSKSELVESTFLRCKFVLQTLCASACLDVTAWLLGQTSLRCLGIYEANEAPSPHKLELYRSFVQRTPVDDPLVVFNLSCANDGLIITTFAAFSPGPAWSAKIIKSSLTGVARIVDIRHFHLYLESLAEIENVISSVAICFPCVYYLTIAVRNADIHIYPDTMPAVLALLPQLEYLHIHFWDNSDAAAGGKYQDYRCQLAAAWAAKCPKLAWIMFPDQGSSHLNREGWNQVWM